MTINQVANYLEIDVSKIVSIENGELTLTPILLNHLSYLYFYPVNRILNDSLIVCSNIRYLNNMTNEEIKSIADINRIALNTQEMNQILKKNSI